MPDAEIEAMGKLADALGDLGDDTRGRVLRWAAERYGVSLAPVRSRPGKGETGGVVDHEDEEVDDADESKNARPSRDGGPKRFQHFAELYDTANPTTDPERVLVASYWVQVITGKASFGSRELNKELKDLGHAVTAINKAMLSNMKKKPALILQISRGGVSPQAQKTYKVSDAGRKWVEARIGLNGTRTR